MKVVINKCFGGFGLSDAGTRAYWERKGKQVFAVGASQLFTLYFDAPLPPEFALTEGGSFMRRDHPEYENYDKWYSAHSLYDKDIARNDPDLVAIVEELGQKASGRFADLAVVEIPDDVDWEISEYDGNEHVAEKHRTWA